MLFTPFLLCQAVDVGSPILCDIAPADPSLVSGFISVDAAVRWYLMFGQVRFRLQGKNCNKQFLHLCFLEFWKPAIAEKALPKMTIFW